MSLELLADGALQMVPSTGGPACLDEGALRDCALDGTALPPGSRLVDVFQQPDGVAWLAARDGLYRHVSGRAGPPQADPAAVFGRVP